MESKIINYKKETPFQTYENINRALKSNTEEICGSFLKNSGDAENLDSYEKSVKLIIIDTLKSKDGVIAALLSNDKQQIRRALHCKWFFDDAVSPDYYKTNIFPNVSFSTRLKIIHQLSKHLKQEDHAEDLFEFIQCNYGKSNAMILLPKCRADFINSHLKDSEVVFRFVVWRKLLLKLLPKYPQFVLEILEGWCNNDSPMSKSLGHCKKIFMYIAKNHSNLFLPFFEKHYHFLHFLHFGDKLRRKLSPALLDMIFKSDRPLYQGMFNEKNLFKDLDFQEKVCFLSKLMTRGKNSSFPCFSHFNTEFGWLLFHLKLKPAKERPALLTAVYQHAFKEDLWEHPEVWTLELLKIMPLEIRENCVSVLGSNNKFDNFLSRTFLVQRNVSEKLAYLLGCKKSIPQLKEMIKKMPSADDRKIVLLEMIESCAINEDLESLCSVCYYIKNRHRNEDPTIISGLLRSVKDLFDSQKFDLKLWTILEELLTMCMVQSEYNYRLYKKMIEKYAFFRLQNNLDPKEQIKNLVKYMLSHTGYRYKFVEDVQLPYADVYFHMCYDELMLAINQGNFEKEKIYDICERIMNNVNDYNAYHTDKKILTSNLKGFTTYLDDLIDHYTKHENGHKLSMIVSFISKDPDLKLKYAELCETYKRQPGIIELLKKNPNNVFEDLENLFRRLFDASNKTRPVVYRRIRRWGKSNTYDRFIDNIYFWKKIFDFYNASEGFKNYACQRFKELNLKDSDLPEKLYALILFSYFTNVSEYEECIQDFIPKNKQIDYKNNSDEFVRVQTKIPTLIKNIKPDSKNFPLIFKYLMGDYLKHVLDSFNSACYNSPVEMVISTLKEKVDSPISVKKAVLRNISNVSTLEEKIKFCNDLWEKEKHDSIRSVIFKQIMKILSDEPLPTEESFNAVIKCILESSEVTIEVRPAVKEIPRRYKDKYVDAIWTFADGISENDKLKNNIKNSVINQFNIKSIHTLSDELCEKIIKSEIFINDSPISVNNFTCYYLLSDPDSIQRKLDLLLDIMRERKKNYDSIVPFIEALTKLSLDRPKNSCKMFNLILQIWPTIFSRHELFDEFLMLQYYKTFQEISAKRDCNDVLNITITFADELKKIIKTTPNYGELLIVFQYTLLKFFGEIRNVSLPVDEILLIRQLITPPERDLLILAAFILPKKDLEGLELMDEAKESESDTMTLEKKINIRYIYEKFKNCKDEVFQIYYFRKFVPKKCDK